jgi:hypothetical protein
MKPDPYLGYSSKEVYEMVQEAIAGNWPYTPKSIKPVVDGKKENKKKLK